MFSNQGENRLARAACGWVRCEIWTKMLKSDIEVSVTSHFWSHYRLNYSAVKHQVRFWSQGTKLWHAGLARNLRTYEDGNGSERLPGCPDRNLGFCFCVVSFLIGGGAFSRVAILYFSLTFQPQHKSLNGWEDTLGEGEERSIKRYFLRIKVAILKG